MVIDHWKQVSKDAEKCFPSPLDELNMKELAQQLNKSLNKLPGRMRAIFKLNRHNNLTYSQIAKKLEVSVKTVEADMGKALKHLRNELKPYIDNE
ncbi:MAG: sigma-70 family RNA polymerase sigma factor [Bacteroidales bacterium]|nr:sigma-70 family RNA polymerase sigma factor [Bacteroidales bacterium]